jgi:hypothetical protein
MDGLAPDELLRQAEFAALMDPALLEQVLAGGGAALLEVDLPPLEPASIAPFSTAAASSQMFAQHHQQPHQPPSPVHAGAAGPQEVGAQVSALSISHRSSDLCSLQAYPYAALAVLPLPQQQHQQQQPAQAHEGAIAAIEMPPPSAAPKQRCAASPLLQTMFRLI